MNSRCFAQCADTGTLYDLRHMFMTAMYGAVADVLSAAYFAGHKSVETTMRIYAHLTEERKKRGAASMKNFLNSRTPMAVQRAVAHAEVENGTDDH